MHLSASLLVLAASALAIPASLSPPSTSWPTDVSWLRTMQKRATKKTCHVQALGGGQDDSSNIISAFSQCQNNSVIVLDGNYTGKFSPSLNLQPSLNTNEIFFSRQIACYQLEQRRDPTYWLLAGSCQYDCTRCPQLANPVS